MHLNALRRQNVQGREGENRLNNPWRDTLIRSMREMQQERNRESTGALNRSQRAVDHGVLAVNPADRSGIEEPGRNEALYGRPSNIRANLPAFIQQLRNLPVQRNNNVNRYIVEQKIGRLMRYSRN